ncbi:MAG: chemotaxis protein CheW [bacterium]|nr:chemotaxis protein CheW [bacterium]
MQQQGTITGEAPLSQQYVVFNIADEEYCIEILKVQEIIRRTPITWLPRRPEYVKGVINLRGEIIPIVDLRVKFGLPAQAYSKFTRILIGQIENRMCGMIVDNVAEVITLAPGQIEKAPVTVSRNASAEYITGIAKVEKRVLILLDIARVLSVDEILSLDDITLSDVEETRG